jgi:hypothetical protein
LHRLTAQYVEEIRAGLHPSLHDYIARYPHYADAIADFVAYYHLFEANIPEDVTMNNSFSAPAQSAWNSVQQRILTNFYLSADSVEGDAPTTLGTACSPCSRVAEQSSPYQATSLDCLQPIEETLDLPQE